MRTLLAFGALLLCNSSASGAFVIDDRSFFAGIEHTFLDFETRGDGSPIGLAFGEASRIPEDEYLSDGFRFQSLVVWQDAGTPPDPDASFSNAVDAAGSWPTVIGGGFGGFAIEFLVPVRAFGIGVVQQGFIGFDAPSLDTTTRITALNADGEVLGEVRLWLDTVDGQTGAQYAGGAFGDEWLTYPYGFLGLATDEPIARLEFDQSWQSVFDDLHFSAIPAPGAGASFTIVGLGALARRRRTRGRHEGQ